MSRYVMLLLSSVCVVTLVFVAGCGNDGDGGGTTAPTDRSEGNQLAREGFDLLADAAIELQGVDLDDPTGPDDVFPEEDYDTIMGKFQEAIAVDAVNPMAHLGIAVLEIFSINYDEDLWDFYGDLVGEPLSGRILNNEITFLAQAPELYLRCGQGILAAPAEAVTFARFQQLIESSVLPKLSNALSHLGHAISLADSEAIMVYTGEEWAEIDCGEIYALRASVNLVAAAFRMMTIYDVDVLGRDGTYAWVADVGDYYDWFDFGDGPTDPWGESADDYRVGDVSGDNWLYLVYRDSNVRADSILASVVNYNLEERSGFLEVRSSAAPLYLLQHIEDAIHDIDDGVDYIMSESDDQSNDVIKQVFITEINDDIADHDPDDPPFMQEWDDIHDVTSWLEGLFTGPYTFDIDGIEVSVNLASLVSGGFGDLKAFLPYYEWLDESDWITCSYLSMDDYDNWDPSGDFGFTYRGEYVELTDIDHIVEYHLSCDMTPLVLLDGPGGDPIYDEFPYFEDYTFGGLFPGMTRETLMELLEY
jgi:hypothetical protein